MRDWGSPDVSSPNAIRRETVQELPTSYYPVGWIAVYLEYVHVATGPSHADPILDYPGYFVTLRDRARHRRSNLDRARNARSTP